MNQNVSNKLMVDFDARTFYTTSSNKNPHKHRGK